MGSVKETLDVVALLTATKEAIVAAKADGVIDWKDSPKVAPVLGALITAIRGGSTVDDELKEATTEQLQEVLTKTLAEVLGLVEALLA